MLFFPTKKSYVSMAKMRIAEIDTLNEKYKDKDPMSNEPNDLYKRTGVSPLEAVTMLFQIPILFALSIFPASIQLRHSFVQMIYQHMIRLVNWFNSGV